MKRSQIRGVGHYVPENVVTNHDLMQIIDTSDEWIRERTGIRERRYFNPDKDTVAGMAANASRMALERAGMQAQEVDFIVFATITPDYFFPGSGVLLQRELGLEGIGAIDLRNACSGFIYGLSVADQFIKTGMYKTVLVVGAEIQSSAMYMTTEHRSTNVYSVMVPGLLCCRPPTSKPTATASPRGYFQPTCMPMAAMPKSCM